MSMRGLRLWTAMEDSICVGCVGYRACVFVAVSGAAVVVAAKVQSRRGVCADGVLLLCCHDC
jgi:hypothetical protein